MLKQISGRDFVCLFQNCMGRIDHQALAQNPRTRQAKSRHAQQDRKVDQQQTACGRRDNISRHADGYKNSAVGGTAHRCIRINAFNAVDVRSFAAARFLGLQSLQQNGILLRCARQARAGGVSRQHNAAPVNRPQLRTVCQRSGTQCHVQRSEFQYGECNAVKNPLAAVNRGAEGNARQPALAQAILAHRKLLRCQHAFEVGPVAGINIPARIHSATKNFPVQVDGP